MDPEGNYVRRHVPILKHFPAEFIYEPWLAPMDVQIKSKCIIGKDYPKPLVDQHTASKDNMAKMKDAFEQAKLTSDDRVDSKRVCFENYEDEPSVKKRKERHIEKRQVENTK